jgi:hypothetical protein
VTGPRVLIRRQRKQHGSDADNSNRPSRRCGPARFGGRVDPPNRPRNRARPLQARGRRGEAERHRGALPGLQGRGEHPAARESPSVPPVRGNGRLLGVARVSVDGLAYGTVLPIGAGTPGVAPYFPTSTFSTRTFFVATSTATIRWWFVSAMYSVPPDRLIPPGS